MSVAIHYDFPRNYEVELLENVPQSKTRPGGPPTAVHASLHQFPARLEEEDRTGIFLRVIPQAANAWIGFFVLGFDSPEIASGIYSCPDPGSLCVVIGGYAYVVDASDPLSWTQIEQRPVVEVKTVPEVKLLLFVGFTSITGLGESARLWTTERLSWEGISVTGIHNTTLHGMGWDMLTDKEIPFEVDLLTGKSKGGAGPGYFSQQTELAP